MSKRDKNLLTIGGFSLLFCGLVALSTLNKHFFVDILASWLTAIGTVGAIIVALWQTKKANYARDNAKKEQEIAEKHRNDKTLQLFDTLSRYERHHLWDTNLKILTYKLGRREFPIDDIENWDSTTRAIYATYSHTLAYQQAHDFSRAFGPKTTPKSRLKNVENLFKKSNNQSFIYIILNNYQEVLSVNLSSYHTLLDETSIEKISDRLLKINKCLFEIEEYGKGEGKSIPLHQIADNVFKYIENLDQPLYNIDKTE